MTGRERVQADLAARTDLGQHGVRDGLTGRIVQARRRGSRASAWEDRDEAWTVRLGHGHVENRS